MKLEIGNFHVKDVVFGDKTFFENGILTINKKEACEFILQDEHITEVDIEIAKPGEDVRIVPIKEARQVTVIKAPLSIPESDKIDGFTIII